MMRIAISCTAVDDDDDGHGPGRSFTNRSVDELVTIPIGDGPIASDMGRVDTITGRRYSRLLPPTVTGKVTTTTVPCTTSCPGRSAGSNHKISPRTSDLDSSGSSSTVLAAAAAVGDNVNDNDNHNHGEIVRPTDVDELLARDLKRLTFLDRTRIQEEVHGVAESPCPVETPAFLEQALIRLQHELDKIPNGPATLSYLEAASSPVSYVHCPAFRMRFLRCELFDAKQAAARIVRYIHLTYDSFGKEAVVGPHTIHHAMLGADVQRALQNGHIQCLPVRDRSGRAVVVSVFYYAFHLPLTVRSKIQQYLFWKVTEDVETQRNGVVLVFWGFGPDCNLEFPTPNRREHLEGKRIMDAVPMRVAAIHFCFQDSPRIRLVKAVATLMVGGHGRTRLTFHAGDTSWDVRYRLMGFGIPVDLLPVTETGNLKVKQWLAWIKVQRWLENNKDQERDEAAAEQQSSSSSSWNAPQQQQQQQLSAQHLLDPDSPTVQCPRLRDVVFRNGTSSLSNPGNAMFRGLLEAYLVQHSLARTNGEKIAVSWQIMDAVERRGGRFLEWHRAGNGKGPNAIGWWVVMHDRNAVRSKVAICLRDLRKLAKAKENVQTSSSSTYAFQEEQGGLKRKRMQPFGGGETDDEGRGQPCVCLF